jgi:hypothetical protein
VVIPQMIARRGRPVELSDVSVSQMTLVRRTRQVTGGAMTSAVRR